MQQPESTRSPQLVCVACEKPTAWMQPICTQCKAAFALVDEQADMAPQRDGRVAIGPTDV